jgi:hypothetical protein
MSAGMLFYVTAWTAIGAFLGFMAIGIVEQETRWRQERHRRG